MRKDTTEFRQKDTTEFKQRFYRWKAGEQVYDKGRVIPHYRTGLDGEDDTVPSDNTRVVNPRLLTAEKIVDLPTAFELARAKHEAEQIGPTPNISQQERDLGRKKYETQLWVLLKKALELATDEMMMCMLDPRYAALGFGLGLVARAAGSVINAGKNLYKGYKVSRAIKTPQITAKNAASITPAQWTAAQDVAIARGDMVEAQRLRDLHFKVNAPNPILSESGNPQKTFHTVGDKYDYRFNQFNPSIEGQHSGVFTTDNPVMSGSYSQKMVSKRVQDDVIEAIRQRELHRYDNYGSGEFYNNLRKEAIKTYSNPKKARKEILKNFPHLNDVEYGRQKELYISLDNPLIINGKGHSWNMIPIEDIPIEMHKYPIVSLDGYGKVASTHTIDRILGGYPETLPKVHYDGAIFRDIMDYGNGSTFVSPKFNKPSTVYDVQNPSNLKLADAVTYDDNGVRIPLGERDNFKLNDIRYSRLTPAQFGRIETQMMDLGDDFKTLEHWLKNVPDKDFHDAIGVPKMFFKDRYKNDEKFLKYFRLRLNKYIFDKSLTDISATPEVMLERQKLSNLFDSDWYKSHLDGMADRDAFITSLLQAVSEVPVFSYKVPKIGIGGYYEPDPISGYGKVFIDDNIKNGGLFYSAQRSGNIGHELGHSAGSFDYIHSNKPAILEEGSYQASKPEYYGDYDETRTRFLNIAANELWEYRNPNLIFDRHIGTFPNSNYTDVLYGYDREFAKHYMQTFKSLFPYLIGGGLSIPALNNK